MKYKVGDRVRIYRNLSKGRVPQGTFIILSRMLFSYSNKYPSGVVYELYGLTGKWSEENLKLVTNRSEVGKRAYRTFIKNGGSRNSKGQFSKKQKIDWKKIAMGIHTAYFCTQDPIIAVSTIKRFAKVFQKHGLIDSNIKI